MRLSMPSVRTLISTLRQLIDDRQGVTALEYGLIAAVMVTAIATTIRGVSAPITQAFQNIYNSFF